MKILLTGKPRSGKTTLLHSLIHGIASKRGLVTSEVRKNGERIGFDLLDNTGRVAILSRTGRPTKYPVSRYFVDLASLDDFIEPLFECRSELLYIDEIGHMQLLSKKFQRLATEYLNADNDFIGTISCVYEHPFIDEVHRREDILLCTVTPENRDELMAALQAALACRGQLRELPDEQQRIVLKLAREYLEADSLIPLRKLFKNAIPYIITGKVEKLSETEFQVQGNHDNHKVVIKHESNYSCDCDLFNGRNQFEGRADECSHIQTIKISL